MRNNYYDTIGPIFYSYFAEYVNSLRTAMVLSATKNDLLGRVPVHSSRCISVTQIIQSRMQSFVSMLPGIEDSVNVDLYALGKRAEILSSDEVIVAHSPVLLHPLLIHLTSDWKANFPSRSCFLE